MVKTVRLAYLALAVSAFCVHNATAMAEGVVAALAGQTFYCEGGNESSGRHYYFKVKNGQVERIDHRFPNQNVIFNIGGASKGQLNQYWSYETLSDERGDRVHLYERVSMRSGSENKHVYRTYELYRNKGGVYMIFYDGVNGARDWTIKMTRDCGYKVGNKIVQSSGQRYWSTTFSKK
ncbi:hypothetical protein [uncultured Cohaesibacter sp.]|uniref:hypothetical protein n=1 Tax=uncultured Cohaesibacter sp. TaxID=1002546 RepID=UPI00292D5B58|nr:hypothetical protein [uncultured Cohaesibacter sp.]